MLRRHWPCSAAAAAFHLQPLRGAGLTQPSISALLTAVPTRWYSSSVHAPKRGAPSEEQRTMNAKKRAQRAGTENAKPANKNSPTTAEAADASPLNAVMEDIALDFATFRRLHPEVPETPTAGRGHNSSDTSTGMMKDDDPRLNEHAEPVFVEEVVVGEAPQKVKPTARQLIEFWCGPSALGIGEESLLGWRKAVATVNNTAALPPSSNGTAGTKRKAKVPKPLLPYVSDACKECDQQLGHRNALVKAMQELKCVLSPLVALHVSQDGTESKFVAKTDIPAGVFLISVPQAVMFTAEPPIPTRTEVRHLREFLNLPSDATGQEEATTLLSFFTSADDLALQLLEVMHSSGDERGDGGDVRKAYCDLLTTTTSPPLNLPFVSNAQSPQGHMMLKFFQDEHTMAKLPLCDGLRTMLGFPSTNSSTPEEMATFWARAKADGSPEDVALSTYHWALSQVICRRMSSGVLVPIVDKLNHSPTPNCYYTMAAATTEAAALSGGGSEQSNSNLSTTNKGGNQFCGLDVVDNLFAGVEASGLYEPHVHVFSVDKIKKGEELTLSYSDADPTTPAGRDMWNIVYGFQPKSKAQLTEMDLQSLVSIISERRIGTRQQLFPEQQQSPRKGKASLTAATGNSLPPPNSEEDSHKGRDNEEEVFY